VPSCGPSSACSTPLVGSGVTAVWQRSAVFGPFGASQECGAALSVWGPLVVTGCPGGNRVGVRALLRCRYGGAGTSLVDAFLVHVLLLGFSNATEEQHAYSARDGWRVLSCVRRVPLAVQIMLFSRGAPSAAGGNTWAPLLNASLNDALAATDPTTVFVGTERFGAAVDLNDRHLAVRCLRTLHCLASSGCA
jgi:hypothetical protein